jgi:hypothetical protein
MGARRDQDVGGVAARGTGARRGAGDGWVDKRPGLVTFAAIMMLIMGSFQVLVVISEIVNSTWLLNLTDDWIGARFLFWGLVDIGVAALALYAGINILRGGRLGQLLGYLFAGLGVLRWLLYTTATPVLAVVIIALDVLIIYGLAHNTDYFETL